MAAVAKTRPGIRQVEDPALRARSSFTRSTAPCASRDSRSVLRRHTFDTLSTVTDVHGPPRVSADGQPSAIAYVLGEVLQLPSDEAAAICEITPPAFRKRLQRARERLQRFMEEHCGVLDPSNACRCRRRIGAAIGRGRVDPAELLFVERVDALKLEMQRFTDAGAIFRSHPELRTPPELVDAVLRAVA